MNEYDGFSTVQDPQEYMNAPAMIVPPDGDDSHSQRSQPPILRAAIDATRGFELLSADEIQAHYAEQNVLQQRISDVVARLDVEVKMREAARNLSRLHRKPSDASLSPSMATGTSSSGARKRISKIFSASSSGSNSYDGASKRQSMGQHRLSMQADEEAELSGEKIRHLEQLRFDLAQRKALVDRRIIQHHAAVMARAIGGVPVPNHRRLQSGASAFSGVSDMSAPSQRQSWVVADMHGKHMRNISGVSAHSMGADSSLATVREHAPSSGGSQVTHNLRLEEEVKALAARIAAALPGMSPAPQGALTFISNAFERLLRELADTRNSAEAYHIQAQHSEERIEFLNRELDRAGAQSRSVSGEPTSGTAGPAVAAGTTPGHEAEAAQLRHELNAERGNLQQLREHNAQQRTELERSVRSLEDVTRMAVQYESERAEFEQLLGSLEARTGLLEKDKAVLLQQRLGATQNSSTLCKEFQRIIGDLMDQHQKELRKLYPRPRPSTTAAAATTNSENTANEEAQSAVSTPGAAAARRNELANDLANEPTRTHYDQERAGAQSVPHEPNGSRAEQRALPSLNTDFSQSPEPLSVHNAVRKPVPNSSESARPDQNDQRAGIKPATASRGGASLTATDARTAYDDHSPLPAPVESDMSLVSEDDDTELSAPRLDRQNSEYSVDYSDYSRSSSVYPDINSAAQSQASVLPRPNQSQASLARAHEYSFNSNDELL